MTYNLHPIFVHFPIALLFLYSIIKILSLPKYFPAVAWKHIERILLVAGILGAFVALATGETAEHLIQPNHQLVEAHSTFAAISVWMYGLLLAGEVLENFASFIQNKINIPFVTKASVFFQKILTNNTVSIVLAILGLVAITVTGLLGGVMVYGTSADPLAGIVLKILGISL